MSNQEFSPNVPMNAMDLDSELTLVDPQSYRYALNIRNGYGSILGACTSVKGNEQVTFVLPTGDNVCIGTAEDERCESVIYFVYNSLGEHTILRYFPNKKTINPLGEIERVAQGPVLAFKQEWKINHAFLIDTKYLYWTDAYTEKEFIEGNPPRKINIEKANVTNRELCYEIHTETATTFFNTVPTSLQITVNDGINTYNEVILQAALNPFVGDPEAFLEFLETTLTTAPWTDWLEVTLCECKLELKTKNQFDRTVVFLMEPLPSPLIEEDFLVVPVDHYPITIPVADIVYNLTEDHISLIKKPPKCEPDVTYTLDIETRSNNVNNNMFQFMVRYWYDDNEKSAWSAISPFAVPLDLDGNFLGLLNAIEIDYTEDILKDTAWRNLIRKVELAVRTSNLDQIKSIDILDLCKIGITKNIFNFFNDRLYKIIASDDFAVSADQQSLKLFDNVPRLTGAMEFVSNREGKGRIFTGANLENYDVEDCVDLNLQIEGTFEDPCFVTIKGTVTVDTTGLPNQQVFDQQNAGRFAFLDDGIIYSNTFVFDVGSGNWVVSEQFRDDLLDGFVVYLAGTDHFGISKNAIYVPNIERDGSFEIKGVPRGKYAMRVANWQVITSDEYGTIHNINNGQAWQKTSAPLLNCAGSVADTGNRAERIVDLTLATGTFDLDTEPGYGPIIVKNLMIIPEPIALVETGRRFTLNAYFLDNGANAGTVEQRKGAIAVERQKFDVQVCTEFDGFTFFFQTLTVFTDHNGFMFFEWDFDLSGGLLPINQWARVKNFYPTVPDVCDPTPGLFRSLNTGNIFSGDLYTSGFYPLFDSPTFTTEFLAVYTGAGDEIVGHPINVVETFLFFNKDVEFTENNKTIAQGTILEATGNGLTEVLMVIERNGRQEETDANGNFAISVYCPWDKEVRDDDRVIPQYLLDKCADFPPTPLNHVLNINEFCNPYDFDTPYVVPTFSYQLAGALTEKGKYLKAGGVYRTGIVYEDKYNRKSTVVEGNTLRIPFFTERGIYDKTYTSWELTGVPPIWADHYRIVRTKDSFYRRYLQMKIIDIEYVIYENVDAGPTTTSFSNADATHLHIKVPNIFDEDPAFDAAVWFFRNENVNRFSPEPRDRVRFILDEEDELIKTNGIIDFEIQGKFVNGSGDFFLIVESQEIFDSNNLIREIFEGWLVELYTPQKVEEVVFYEIGECHDIIDPGTPIRRHGGPQNQIFGVQPARGFLVGGDTYWRKRTFTVDEGQVYKISVENLNMSDRFPSINEDIGRVNVKDEDFGERFYYNKITFSDIFVPGTNKNGLSSFIAVDQQFTDVRHGIMKNLVYVGEVLLAICEFKIQPFYVGKDNVLSLSGRETLGRSDRTMNMANELIQDFGTQHPSSIAYDGNYCYGFDSRQGVAWRYASNGLTEISQYKLINEFNAIGKDFRALPSKNNDILAIFDREYKCYLLTFPQINGRPAVTISFDESKNGWNTYLSYLPEYYGITGQILISFMDGQLWVHESDNVPRSNFYGVQYDNDIDIVFNRYPKATKLFFNIEEQSDKMFYCPEILIPPNEPYPLGMSSELRANRFSNYEGHWNSDFLRDKNDTSAQFISILDVTERETTALLKGRNLRGEVLVVKLRLNNQGEDFIMKRIDIGFALSEETKK
jgi:hypothetical protein